MERVALPESARLRWRAPALALLGALLLFGALALSSGGALLAWSLVGLTHWPLQAAALAVLYLVPGLTLLRLLWPRERVLAPLAHMALALGLSVALPPLLLLLFWLLGLPWRGATTWVYLAISLLIYVRFLILDFANQAKIERPLANLKSRMAPDGATFALIGISIAALLVRLYAMRDLPVGLLGDSYHHTLMAQLLVENGGIFRSWQPYAPLATFTYHFGFHANIAFVHYVTGIDVVQCLVWTGQILNAIVVPLVFALALALGSSRWAGVWAALIVGFVSNLPAFFVNWGRYTQLTGQIVLIVVVVCWITLVESIEDEGRSRNVPQQRSVFRLSLFVFGQSGRQSWKLLLLTSLATAALILTHYLVTALAAAFIGSYLLALLLARRSWPLARKVALLIAPAALLALLLVAPWLVNVAGSHLLRNATSLVAGGPAQAAVITQLSAIEPVVPRYVDGAVLLGALIGLLIAASRRDWRMALLAVWCALLVIVVVPYVVGLPGAGVIDNMTALGTLYIPTALLAGYALAAAQERGAALLVRLPAPDLAGAALVGAALLLVIAGNAGWQSHVAGDETALVVDADLAAMQWIRDNTPPSARFVINSFPAYGGSLAAGSDAGWWLPLLAQRATTLPPLNYGSEQGEQPNYQWAVNALVMKLRGHPLTDTTPVKVDLSRPVALKTLAANQIDYIYSGAHPYPRSKVVDRIDTAKLRASPFFRLVYARGGVEIFQFLKSK